MEELRQAGLVDGAVIASRTEDHYADARTLIDAGLRVMLEKPLTHSLESAREFGIRHLLGIKQPDSQRPERELEAFIVLDRFATLLPSA